MQSFCRVLIELQKLTCRQKAMKSRLPSPRRKIILAIVFAHKVLNSNFDVVVNEMEEQEEKVLIVGTIRQAYPHPERLATDQDRFPTFWFRFKEGDRMARCAGKSAQGGAIKTPLIEFCLSREQMKTCRAQAWRENRLALIVSAIVETRQDNSRYIASLSTIDSIFYCDDERITGTQVKIAMPLPAFKIDYAKRFDQQPHRPNDSFTPEPRCTICGTLEKNCCCEFRRALRAKKAKKKAEQAEYEEKIKRGGAAAIYARRAIPHSIFAQDR